MERILASQGQLRMEARGVQLGFLVPPSLPVSKMDQLRKVATSSNILRACEQVWKASLEA